MKQLSEPLISPDIKLPELTWGVVGLSIVLSIILAMSNAYLALKVGILASASIPAAIVSMGVLRFFSNANILQNNLVETAASAGEAVAGGIVYTVPALILIHFWQGFEYWENFLIAILGGLLGVLFSVPLRRVLVTEKRLHFPEGRAIAEVLLAGHEQLGAFRLIVLGGLAGALLEFLQSGLKVIADAINSWHVLGRAVVGGGCGFSATMIGVGYIIGFQMGMSLFIGALIGWFFGVPWFSSQLPGLPEAISATDIAMELYAEKIRYVGVGAMLIAGAWTVLTLIKPFFVSIVEGFKAVRGYKLSGNIPRTEQDIPFIYLLLGILLLMLAMYFFFRNEFPINALGLPGQLQPAILISALLYILLFGFIFCAITGYFSGLVGVTASPGSAIIIAGLLLAAILLQVLLSNYELNTILESKQAAAAITIFLGAIITGAAAIANDNIQDLKVGHIVGSTPWKQQLMLMLGVVTSAAVIPLVMQLLFDVYGVGDVLPRSGMDPHEALPAPPAALMAAVVQGVFDYALPWSLVLLGGGVVISFILVNCCLPKTMKLSILGIAMGIYLPLTTSMPLFLGSAMAFFCNATLRRRGFSYLQIMARRHNGILLACGLVAGAALMSVLLAIPFALLGGPDSLKILLPYWQPVGNVLGFATVLGLGVWFYRVGCGKKND